MYYYFYYLIYIVSQHIVIKMPRSIDDLSPFFDEKVIEVLRENNYSEIWDDQWECIQKCLVDRKNVFIGLPTGSGKTFPALLSVIDTVLKKRGKAIYIVPLRALARQKYEQFNRILAPLGISVGITTGDYAKCEYTNIGRKDVIIATIEKVDSLIRHNEEWLYDVSLFVIDEIQMVDDKSRGLTLEIVVSEIIRKFKKAQRIALSAVIGNPEEIKTWLADDIVFNKNRIIPLHAGILSNYGILQIEKEKIKIPIRKNVYTHNKGSMDRWKSIRYGNTIDLVKYFINQEKQCIIFTNARDHAESLAVALALDIKRGGYSIDEVVCKEISQLIDDSIEEKTKFSKNLIACVRLGVSFHHAGLQLIQRDIIEKNFENRNLKVLVSTPTLEQGVNLPANVVIISDYLKWNGHDFEPHPINSVLNMMGRAGRPGYHKFGEAILIEDQSVDGQLYGKYIKKNPERVLSQLRVARTRQKHLNGLIASNRIIPIEEIFEYLKTTLWFTIYRYEFEEFDLRKEIFKDLSYLEDNGFIKKSGSYYIPTKFGKAVSDSCIDCETGLLFLRGSQKIMSSLYTEKDLENPWPIFQLLLLSPEVNNYRPYDNDFEGLELASRFKAKDLLLSRMPDNGDDVEKQTYSRKSLAAFLLCNWMEEKPLEEIIGKYPELRDADFYELGEMLEWLGDAFVKIAILNGVSKGITDRILIYCDRVVGGIKEELLEYIKIEGVRRKSARKLFNAGFTYNSLKDLDHDALSKLVGPFVSKKIRDHFEKVTKEGEESIFREEQIYEEIAEIVAEEKHIKEMVEKSGKNKEYLTNNLRETKFTERLEKIKLFCENQLTWVHSDSKYFRFFTNHGTPHSNNVFNLMNQLLDNWELKKGEKRLNEYEYFLLAVCSWCHDLGMLKQEGEDYDNLDVVKNVRKEHARRIIPFLEKNYLKMGLLNDTEKAIVAQICLHHSSNEKIDNVVETQAVLLDKKPSSIRSKLISALLRLADALDTDKNRLPREEHRNHHLISEIQRDEYRKIEIVQEVVISIEEKSILIQVLLNKSDSDADKIFNEVKDKLIEEFESVKPILLDHGINIKNIQFLVTRA